MSAVLLCCHLGQAVAVEKPAGFIWVSDSLTSPNRPVTIDAVLTASGDRNGTVSGEPLELVVDGKTAATVATGADGRAQFRYTPTSRGNKSVTVRTGDQARISASATATVASWERRTPLLIVEVAAIRADQAGPEPNSDAAEELGKLTQFYYNVIYVEVDAGGGDRLRTTDRTRRWLSEHKFPSGHVLTLASGEGVLGGKIDELRAAGWTTLKIGVGRTKPFAEAFLQRRLDVVLVPEPAKGEVPRKARVAKDWKDVRKKL